MKAPFLLAAAVALADGLARLLLVRGSARVADDPAGPRSVLRGPRVWAAAGAVVLGPAPSPPAGVGRPG